MQTIVYVRDMVRSASFYAALLGILAPQVLPGKSWLPFEVNGAVLALHTADPLPPINGRAELSLVSDTHLEELIARLTKTGIEAEPIQPQPFGRSTIVHDPDGLAIQINEH